MENLNLYYADSSRRSQIFARVQSRFTVAGEISSNSAVSSTVSPPQNPRFAMAKAVTTKIKLLSSADTGFYYVTRKNSQVQAGQQRRYPVTRMGQEEVLRDAFIRAQDYKREWDDYRVQLSQWELEKYLATL